MAREKITDSFALEFANKWATSWNNHNLDSVLNLYSDDFTVISPLAAKLLPETYGYLYGKNEIRAYWTKGLQLIPNLQFKIIDVLIGIKSISIYYINSATCRKTIEVMEFDENNKVCKVVVHYSN